MSRESLASARSRWSRASRLRPRSFSAMPARTRRRGASDGLACGPERARATPRRARSRPASSESRSPKRVTCRSAATSRVCGSSGSAASARVSAARASASRSRSASASARSRIGARSRGALSRASSAQASAPSGRPASRARAAAATSSREVASPRPGRQGDDGSRARSSWPPVPPDGEERPRWAPSSGGTSGDRAVHAAARRRAAIAETARLIAALPAARGAPDRRGRGPPGWGAPGPRRSPRRR